MLRSYVVSSLADCARRAIQLNRPEVIAITGSVGKSSAKEAIGALFAGDPSVRVSPKNFNSEIGLPLAVLELPNGHRSALKWLQVLRLASKRSRKADPSFPRTLVLEMGVDHPGDMAKLVDIAPPNVAVVTAIGESHYEFFGSLEAITNEKMRLVEALHKDGVAVLNRDDKEVWDARGRARGKVVSYGFHEEADVRCLEGSMRYEADPAKDPGTHAKVSYAGSLVPFFFPGVLGGHSLYAPLAAAAVGVARGMNLVDISAKLRSYVPPAGRMRAIPGIKRTMLIDDTYNAAAPRSVKAALAVLAGYPVVSPSDDKRIAVLGDMLELGAISVEAHREVGRAAVAGHLDMLVFVGQRMAEAHQASLEAGAPPDRTYHFATPEEAGRFVQERMKQGDVVLVKGSQGMRMEKVVRELMADPLRASELLVRQDPEWM
jgi:UDP-N-acetylmuramoyl-tripeptide--D-alanyl-D-alanine ligase